MSVSETHDHDDAPPVFFLSQSPPLEQATSHTADVDGVETTLASPSILSPAVRYCDHTPPIFHQMSTKETNKHIDATIGTLLGSPHDIDKALSVFTTLPPGHHSRLIDKLVSSVIELTQAEAQIVAYFFYCTRMKNLCSGAAFNTGFSLTASALEDIGVNYQKALILFVTMAKGAGLHRKSDRCTRLLNELEVHRDALGSLLD